MKTFRVRGKAWPSLLIAHLQNHPRRKGDISECLRKYTVRSGLELPLTRKVTLAWTLKLAVVLWNYLTGGQSSLISRWRSQLCGIGKGGANCRLPFDFPVKSGSQIYFFNVGICLLMCSGKSCCVLDLGDFCSWKCNFWVGKYGHNKTECATKTRQNAHFVLFCLIKKAFCLTFCVFFLIFFSEYRQSTLFQIFFEVETISYKDTNRCDKLVSDTTSHPPTYSKSEYGLAFLARAFAVRKNHLVSLLLRKQLHQSDSISLPWKTELG